MFRLFKCLKKTYIPSAQFMRKYYMQFFKNEEREKKKGGKQENKGKNKLVNSSLQGL